MSESPTSQKKSSKWIALTGVAMGTFMSTLDISIVNISLPTLVEQLDTSFALVQWVMLSYALMTTSLILSVARLGDIIGKKRVYMTGMAIFTVGSLLCGLSRSIESLIAFRALQGMGGVAMTALGLAIATEIFPENERGRAIGILGGVVSVGIAAGPTIGGLLIGLVNWQAAFLVNIPVGLLALLIVWRVVPQSTYTDPEAKFDYWGAILIFVTMASYALGMTMGQERGFTNGLVMGLLAISIISLAGFIRTEMTVKQPMLQMGFFKNRLFSISLIMALLVFIVINGNFILPFFLTLVRGYPTEKVGLMIAIQPVAMGFFAPAAGALSDRYGCRKISIIGLFVTAGACLALSTLTQDTTIWGFVLRLAPMGIGIGLFNSPNNSAVMGSVPKQHLGVASGLLSLSRSIGQTTGVPLIGAIFTALVLNAAGLPFGHELSEAGAAALVHGINWTYRIAAIIILAATILAVVALRIDDREQAAA